MCWPLNGTIREERRMRFLYVSVKLSVRSVVRSTMLRLSAPALVALQRWNLIFLHGCNTVGADHGWSSGPPSASAAVQAAPS
jgi:hypothetical protein